MDDDRLSDNPLAPVGLVLSIIGGPIGLIVSILALRRADRTGEGRTMALTGIGIAVAWLAIGVFVLTARVNGSEPPVNTEVVAVEGTVVTVNPEVADKTPPSAPSITSRQLSALAANPAAVKGETFTVLGQAVTDGAETNEVIAFVRPTGGTGEPVEVKALLRGALMSDVATDDQFTATVTATGTKAEGLPLLQVSDLDVS